MKYTQKNKILLLFLGLCCILFWKNRVFATEYSSTNFVSKDPVIDQGAQNSSSTSFGIGQSFEQSVIGRSTSTNFQLWSGFQYFFKVNANTLTASPGDSQVVLNWGVPTTFLGISVGAYEVGVGTVSGSYTFTSVGNITNYTQTGLSNGTTYYFKIKAKTAAGTFLVFSNEISAIPTSSGQPGGGGGVGSSIIFSGFAYPNSQVFLLQNAGVKASVFADSQGKFSLSLGNINPGSYQFLIYAKDSQGNRSAFLPIIGTVSQYQSPEIKNIFLPPTLNIDKSEVKFSEILNIYGFSQAKSKVVLDLKPFGIPNFQTISGEDGYYSYILDTSKLKKGDFVLKSKSFLELFESIFSDPVLFKIGDKTTISPPVGLCPQKADFNADCKVDLVDFSILAFWFEKTHFPEKMDLNIDGKIDLIDISILMFYWQG